MKNIIYALEYTDPNGYTYHDNREYTSLEEAQKIADKTTYLGTVSVVKKVGAMYLPLDTDPKDTKTIIKKLYSIIDLMSFRKGLALLKQLDFQPMLDVKIFYDRVEMLIAYSKDLKKVIKYTFYKEIEEKFLLDPDIKVSPYNKTEISYGDGAEDFCWNIIDAKSIDRDGETIVEWFRYEHEENEYSWEKFDEDIEALTAFKWAGQQEIFNIIIRDIFSKVTGCSEEVGLKVLQHEIKNNKWIKNIPSKFLDFRIDDNVLEYTCYHSYIYTDLWFNDWLPVIYFDYDKNKWLVDCECF